MAHFGFEAYRKGFFGELLHGAWRILAMGVGSVEKMTKTARFRTLCRLAMPAKPHPQALGRASNGFRRSLNLRDFTTTLYRCDSLNPPVPGTGIFVARQKIRML
jgi:hypothetical protein